MALITPSISLLVVSAYRYLMASGVIADLISENLLGYDIPTTDIWHTGWVFRSEADGLPFRPIEGTGKSAITLYSYDSWAASSLYHSALYPRLHLSIFSDASRDANGNITKHDATDKAYRIFESIHPLFHDAPNQVHKFDELQIISTIAGGGFSIGEIPNGDSSVRGDIVYDIAL